LEAVPREGWKLYREKVGNFTERRLEAVTREGWKLYRKKVGSCTEREFASWLKEFRIPTNLSLEAILRGIFKVY
jgi:hypothetical protein